MLRRDFLKYVVVSSAALMLGCTSKTNVTNVSNTTPASTAVMQAYRSTFVLGYGKDHKLNGGKWGIGFFPKIHVLERLVEYDL